MLRLVSFQRRCAPSQIVRHHHRAWFSVRKPLNRSNAATLRESRKRQMPSERRAEVASRGIDYRYRKGGSSAPDGNNVASKWGSSSGSTQQEPRKQHREKDSQASRGKKKKFISFFDEIDMLMEEKKRAKDSKKSSPVSSEGGPPHGKAATGNTAGRAEQPFSSGRSAVHDILDKSVEQKPAKIGLNGRSIFDVFPVPEPPPPPNPNAFDKEAFEQYLAIVDEIVQNKKFRKAGTQNEMSEESLETIIAWLKLDEKSLDYDYPILTRFIRGLEASKGDSRKAAKDFRGQLQQQSALFLDKHGLTKKHLYACKGALIQVGNLCAKQALSAPLEVAMEKIKEAGILLDQKSLNSYLYASTTFSGSSAKNRRTLDRLSSGQSVLDLLSNKASSPAETVLVSDQESASDHEDIDLSEEIAAFHDILFAPTEQSVAVRVKALVAMRDAKGAENLLDLLPSDDGGLRLRTYLPVMRCYLENGDVSSALRLFVQMRNVSTVILEADTYVQLLTALARAGCFGHAAEPIEGAEAMGYAPAGPSLLDQLVENMAADALDINSALARRLYGAFEAAFRGTLAAQNIAELHPLAPLPVDNSPASAKDLVVSRVAIDTQTALCPRTGARLRLITLENQEREQLKASLIELAGQRFDKLGIDRKTDEDAKVALQTFSEELDTQTGDPYTAIIDGANVAFYMQNFSQGRFNFYQIQFMVDTLEQMGEKPLVIMPRKYISPTFNIYKSGTLVRQKLHEDELEIIRRLSDSRKLYVVKSGHLDDFYWMMASIADQTASRKGRDLTVPPQDESGRWPGMRPMLVTNDQMRDHRLELMEPRLFRRWHSSFIVNYNFTAFVGSECVDKEIGFCAPDFFSREIQGNPTYGLTEGTMIGTAWHFPVSDWEANQRFCLRLPLESTEAE